MSRDPIAARVEAGERLSPSEVVALASRPDMLDLGMLADEARRRRHGDRVTFLRVAHVALADAPGAGAFPESAGEIRLDGRPETLDEAAAALGSVIQRARGVPVTAFSLSDLDVLARRAGMSLPACLAHLKAAGLERLAEASMDSPSLERSLTAAAEAGVRAPRVVCEGGQTEWVGMVLQVARLQDRLQSLRAIAPLPRRTGDALPTTGYDDLKKVALARLVASNVESIQVDWALHGPKLAQVALAFGADDLDNVPAGGGEGIGARRAPLEEVRRNIRAAALVPVERDGNWAHLAGRG